MPDALKMRDIDPESYRHPGEREARRRIHAMPGLAGFLDLAAGCADGAAGRQAEIASMARISEGVYPRLDELWKGMEDDFGLRGVAVHIAFASPEPWTMGGDGKKPLVTLSSRLLDELLAGDMRTLLAMIAGAIRLGNAGFHATSDFLR